MAARPQHSQSGGDRVIGTHEVQDRRRFAVRQGVGRLPGGRRRVRSAFPGQFPGRETGIDGYHPGRAYGFQNLHGQMPQPARSDHHRRIARAQVGAGAGPVGGQPGVGQRRVGGRVGSGGQGEQGAFPAQQVFGVSAGGVQAGGDPVRGAGVRSPPFRPAEAVRLEGVADHRLALPHARHRLARPVHVTGVFVSEDVGERGFHFAGQNMQVGAAHPGGRHPHHHLIRLGYFRVGDILHTQQRPD